MTLTRTRGDLLPDGVNQVREKSCNFTRIEIPESFESHRDGEVMSLTWPITVHNAVSCSVAVLMIVQQSLGGSHRIKVRVADHPLNRTK